MRARPVDPRAPSAAELAAMYDVLNGSFLHDHPGHPPRAPEDLRANLRAPWPGCRSACWLGLDGDEAVGLASMRMPGGAHAGIADMTIDVLPARRRSGVGRTLLREVVRLAYASGRTTIIGRSVEPGPATGFAAAMAAHPVGYEVRSMLGVHGAEPVCAQPPVGYELIRLLGATPAELHDDVAEVHDEMAEASTGAGAWSHQTYGGAALAAVDTTLAARGVTQLRVLTRHRSSGELVGISSVLISPHSPYRSEQGNTTVLPAHRGNGLGLAMKAEMLQWLRADFPAVQELNTWTARDTASMRAVNSRLGYQDTGTWTRWQAPVYELTEKLGLV